MFCDWFSFGSCEELAIVWVRRWGFRKSLRVCEELLFGTAGFRKLISLLFAMIFGSQYAPFCCSVLQNFFAIIVVLSNCFKNPLKLRQWKRSLRRRRIINMRWKWWTSFWRPRLQRQNVGKILLSSLFFFSQFL